MDIGGVELAFHALQEGSQNPHYNWAHSVAAQEQEPLGALNDTNAVSILTSRGNERRLFDWVRSGGSLWNVINFATKFFRQRQYSTKRPIILCNLFFALRGYIVRKEESCCSCFPWSRLSRWAGRRALTLFHQQKVEHFEQSRKDGFTGFTDLYTIVTGERPPYINDHELLTNLALAFQRMRVPLTSANWMAYLNPKEGPPINMGVIISAVDQLCLYCNFFTHNPRIMVNLAGSIASLLEAEEAFYQRAHSVLGDNVAARNTVTQPVTVLLEKLGKSDDLDPKDPRSAISPSIEWLIADIVTGEAMRTEEVIVPAFLRLFESQVITQDKWKALFREGYKSKPPFDEIYRLLDHISSSPGLELISLDANVRRNWAESIENLVQIIEASSDSIQERDLFVFLKERITSTPRGVAEEIAAIRDASDTVPSSDVSEEGPQVVTVPHSLYYFITVAKSTLIPSTLSKRKEAAQAALCRQQNSFTPIAWDSIFPFTQSAHGDPMLSLQIVQFIRNLLYEPKISSLTEEQKNNISAQLRILLEGNMGALSQEAQNVAEYERNRTVTREQAEKLVTQFHSALYRLHRIRPNPSTVPGSPTAAGDSRRNVQMVHASPGSYRAQDFRRILSVLPQPVTSKEPSHSEEGNLLEG